MISFISLTIREVEWLGQPGGKDGCLQLGVNSKQSANNPPLPTPVLSTKKACVGSVPGLTTGRGLIFCIHTTFLYIQAKTKRAFFNTFAKN